MRILCVIVEMQVARLAVEMKALRSSTTVSDAPRTGRSHQWASRFSGNNSVAVSDSMESRNLHKEADAPASPLDWIGRAWSDVERAWTDVVDNVGRTLQPPVTNGPQN